jgi:hypothetical protein
MHSLLNLQVGLFRVMGRSFGVDITRVGELRREEIEPQTIDGN